jgi:DnaJ-class molecular chaperone
MERLLLLCCRSCLKGDGDNNEYYEILELPNRTVNQEAIKKAFKKASLNYHPDKLAQRGIEVTAENKLKFLKVTNRRKNILIRRR